MGYPTADMQSAVDAAAKANNLPPNYVASMIQIESGWDPSAVSWTGVQGIAQITSGTWSSIYPSGSPPYSTDPAAQIQASSVLLGKYYKQYGGDPTLMAIAYNAGPGVANLAQSYVKGGATDVQAAIMASQNYRDKNGNPLTGAKQQEMLDHAGNYLSALGQDGGDYHTAALTVQAPNTAASPLATDDSIDVALPVTGTVLKQDSLATVQALANPTLVNPKGLTDVVPWYKNRDIVQVNKPVQDMPDPISFRLFMEPDGRSPMGVTLKLNASLEQESREMRHIVAQEPTRTAYLLTLWGSQPDVISGHGTTGVFMNALGLTDFLSYSALDANTRRVLSTGIGLIAPGTRATVLQKSADPATNFSKDAFRIAAKDAFFELLSAFRNNATTWYNTADRDGSYSTLGNTQGEWSSVTGSSTFQNAARNNDVVTRGSVLMQYRNSSFYGYFKAFDFEMDAKNPFSWNFNFVFQVENSFTSVPVLGGAQ